MKNQYFGDINDYRKYGLIRYLTDFGRLTAAVCWMLTPNDGRTDGRFTTYLEEPDKWRHFDPPLYDTLKEIVISQNRRSVLLAEKMNVIPSAKYYDAIITDLSLDRLSYFESFADFSRSYGLIFFDPDNGIEVKSKKYGCKDSSKYLYWNELEQFFGNNHSILIYQHFRREKRATFIEKMAQKMRARTGVGTVYAFCTSNVVLFLLVQSKHQDFFERQVSRLSEVWVAQIVARKYC